VCRRARRAVFEGLDQLEEASDVVAGSVLALGLAAGARRFFFYA